MINTREDTVLLRGGCLELMKDIPYKSIDMILCDLPYGVTEYEWDSIINGQELFEQYKRICKQNANQSILSMRRIRGNIEPERKNGKKYQIKILKKKMKLI